MFYRLITDDDVFTISAYAHLDELRYSGGGSKTRTIHGLGKEYIEYVINSPVDVDGMCGILWPRYLRFPMQ